jgi:hypothetical protein
MNLFLDDYRFPYQVTWDQDFPLGKRWFIVRNFDEFKKVIDLIEIDEIEHIAFDHDLAAEHYNQTGTIDDGQTGFHCAKYLVEQCMNRNAKLPNFSSHSMNPGGRENILSYLENYRQFSK